jgi:hypothetical protein
MSLIKINLKPTDKDLRLFGRAALVASVLLTVLLYLIKGLAFQWCAIIVGIGLLIFVASIVSIRFIRWIYIGLTLLTFPIGFSISFIIMAIFYYGILTPLGLIFRLIGRDPLRRKFDKTTKSYWIPHRPCEKNERYFSQF